MSEPVETGIAEDLLAYLEVRMRSRWEDASLNGQSARSMAILLGVTPEGTVIASFLTVRDWAHDMAIIPGAREHMHGL